MSIGRKVQVERLRCGLATADLAAAAEVPEETLISIEQNRIPMSAETLSALSGIFGVSREWLMGLPEGLFRLVDQRTGRALISECYRLQNQAALVRFSSIRPGQVDKLGDLRDFLAGVGGAPAAFVEARLVEERGCPLSWLWGDDDPAGNLALADLCALLSSAAAGAPSVPVFGLRIWQRRLELGMGEKVLAGLLNISLPELKALEEGEGVRLSPKEASAIARALGVSVDWLSEYPEGDAGMPRHVSVRECRVDGEALYRSMKPLPGSCVDELSERCGIPAPDLAYIMYKRGVFPVSPQALSRISAYLGTPVTKLMGWRQAPGVY